MTDSSSETELLRSAAGDQQRALRDLFQEHRQRLQIMAQIRLDRRLQGRVDPDDVVQDAFLEATRRLESYLKSPPMPFFLWLRFLVAEQITNLQRHHLGAQKRDARREISLYTHPLPLASSAALAARLVGKISTPSEQALRAERILNVQEALDAMSDMDREVLALRHFEELSNREAAAVLGIDESAASNRYARALTRLGKILQQYKGR